MRALTAIIFLNMGILLAIDQENLMHENVEIKPIQMHQAKEVKRMILECAHELWQKECTIEEFEKELDDIDEFEDLQDVHASYFDNNGIFLVLLDNQKVVGAGAIRNFNGEICELMRLWFLKEYRGKGLGLVMVNRLLDFAKAHGYKKIRLDVYHPEVQTRAVNFYRKLGFYEIEQYNNYPAKLFMEKAL